MTTAVQFVEARRWLDRVKFNGMVFEIRCDHGTEWFDFVIIHNVLDADTLKPNIIVSRRAIPDPLLRDKAGFLKWVWYCVKERALHEACEFFLIDGVRVYDPHKHPV